MCVWGHIPNLHKLWTAAKVRLKPGQDTTCNTEREFQTSQQYIVSDAVKCCTYVECHQDSTELIINIPVDVVEYFQQSSLRTVYILMNCASLKSTATAPCTFCTSGSPAKTK